MKKIFIIEDNDDCAFLLKSILCHYLKLDCTIVHSLAEAREMLKKSKPDLVLTDLLLDDGLATPLIDWIKEIYPDCPVVVVTAYYYATRELQGRNVILFRKPINIEHFTTIMENFTLH